MELIGNFKLLFRFEYPVKCESSTRALECDHQSIRDVLESSFPTTAEANLVNELRESGALWVSLVAETEQGDVIGHVAFSPVSLDFRDAPGDSADRIAAATAVAAVGGGVGLGPVAVRPEWQRRGVGSALVRQGLERCRTLEQRPAFCVVLGDPHFYARFGFRPARTFGLTSDYDDHHTTTSTSINSQAKCAEQINLDSADAPFMVLEFLPGALSGVRAHVLYHKSFNSL